jgi:HK97 family phage prohead protease
MTSPSLTHFDARLIEIELKAAAEGVQPDGTFTGYGSVFEEVDGQGDVMARGAFIRTLGEPGKAKRMPRLLYQHDWDRPIGVWTEIVEEEKGLRCVGQLNLDTQTGRESYSLLKQGAIDGLSVGIRIQKSTRDANGIRRLLDVDLAEVSLVTFPAVRSARVDGVKSATNTNPSTLVAAINRASLATSLASAAARLALSHRN